MRVGLYGLPTAGKTYILDAVRNFEVLAGSSLLKEISPGFHSLSATDKEVVRKQLARRLKEKDNFIMDGHYSFGEEVVFTEEDGQLYDVILYLYVDPAILKMRMEDSIRNSKYLRFDIEKWQLLELERLRQYCHRHNKDFYVIDHPEQGYFSNIDIVVEFIHSIAAGYSCVTFARKCADIILRDIKTSQITLTDGDKTLIIEDSSSFIGYKTHIFDGNFYTGFQAWRHSREMTDYLRDTEYSNGSIEEMRIHFNDVVIGRLMKPTVILTSGYYGIWKQIADKFEMPIFYGEQMSAETKYYIVKFLQKANMKVVAYGDGMNDYYMLKQADEGYLVSKPDGSLSCSLKNKNLEGIVIV